MCDYNFCNVMQKLLIAQYLRTLVHNTQKGGNELIKAPPALFFISVFKSYFFFVFAVFLRLSDLQIFRDKNMKANLLLSHVKCCEVKSRQKYEGKSTIERREMQR